MQSFRNIRNAFLIPKLIIEMPYSTHQVICNVYNCNYINVYVHAYGIFSCTEECRQICKEVIKKIWTATVSRTMLLRQHNIIPILLACSLYLVLTTNTYICSTLPHTLQNVLHILANQQNYLVIRIPLAHHLYINHLVVFFITTNLE